MHTLSVLGYLGKNKKYQQNCMVIGNDSKLKLSIRNVYIYISIHNEIKSRTGNYAQCF